MFGATPNNRRQKPQRHYAQQQPSPEQPLSRPEQPPNQPVDYSAPLQQLYYQKEDDYDPYQQQHQVGRSGSSHSRVHSTPAPVVLTVRKQHFQNTSAVPATMRNPHTDSRQTNCLMSFVNRLWRRILGVQPAGNLSSHMTVRSMTISTAVILSFMFLYMRSLITSLKQQQELLHQHHTSSGSLGGIPEFFLDHLPFSPASMSSSSLDEMIGVGGLIGGGGDGGEDQNWLQNYDIHSCSSPEARIAWPYNYEFCEPSEEQEPKDDDEEEPRLVGQSKTSSLTCGICDQTRFTKFLRQMSDVAREYLTTQIPEPCYVLSYSVEFGKVSKKFNPVHRENMNSSYVNNCMIVFLIREEEHPMNKIHTGEWEGVNIVTGSGPTATSYNGGRFLMYSHVEKYALRVPVPQDILPYKSMRRNVKLIKFHGMQIFHWHPRLIWIDGKFNHYINPDRLIQYYRDTVEKHDTCATVVALKSDPATMGIREHNRFTKPTFKGHCATVITALSMRPDLTDSPGAIWKMCEMYLRDVLFPNSNNENSKDNNNEKEKKKNEAFQPDDRLALLYKMLQTTQGGSSKTALSSSTSVEATEKDSLVTAAHQSNLRLLKSSLSPLDDFLIDSAIIVWNMNPPRCGQFLADLACTWADQVRCFSDRDQISFPYVMNMFNFVETGGGGSTEDLLLWGKLSHLEANGEDEDKEDSGRRFEDDYDKQSGDELKPMVQIINDQCHWYNGPTFDCARNQTITRQRDEEERIRVMLEKNRAKEQQKDQRRKGRRIFDTVLKEFVDQHGAEAVEEALVHLMKQYASDGEEEIKKFDVEGNIIFTQDVARQQLSKMEKEEKNTERGRQKDKEQQEDVKIAFFGAHAQQANPADDDDDDDNVGGTSEK